MEEVGLPVDDGGESWSKWSETMTKEGSSRSDEGEKGND